MRTIPEWREGAAAGTSLAALKAGGAGKKGLLTSSPTMPGGLSRDLSRILRPQAAYRWLLPSLAAITPQYIEMTLRGALAGNHVQAWELFDLMEDSWPRLSKNANQLKMEVEMEVGSWKARAYQEEGESPSDTAKERARLVNAALLGMRPRAAADENDFRGTVRDIMDAWLKGQVVLETDWEVRSAGKSGDIIAPRATFWVHPTCVAWSMEGELGLRLELTNGQSPIGNSQGGNSRSPIANSQRGTLTPGVWQSTSSQPRPSSVAPFPEDKFLIGICKAKSGTALGAARLRALAWWWCAGNFSADWLLNLAQLWSLPFRWANYDSNAPQPTIDAICSMLENMGSNAWAAFPAGTEMKLEYPKGGGSGSGPADNMVDRADKNCDLLVLGQTLTSDVSQDAGSRSQGEVHERVEDKIKSAACGYVASVLNTQLIPSILRLNYGEDADTERPEFKADDEEEGSLQFKRMILQNWSQQSTLSAVMANLSDVKQMVRDSGLPVNEDAADPWVPVKDAQGNLVTGELMKDSEGDVIGARTEGGGEKTEDGGLKTEDGGRKAEDGGRKAEDGKGGGLLTSSPTGKPTAEDGGLKITDKEDRVEARDSQSQIANSQVAAGNDEGLESSGVEHYAAAVASDLEHVRMLVAGLQEIADDRVLAQRALEVRDEIGRLQTDILKMPRSARALAEVQIAAFFEGLTEDAGKKTEDGGQRTEG